MKVIQMTRSKLKLAYIIQRYRYRQGYSIEDLAFKISIRPEYLEAIELDKYNEVIPNNEVKGIIKKICYVLNLKYYRVLNLYEKEKFNHINIYDKENYISHKVKNLSINNKLFKEIGLFIVAILIISYISYQIYFFIKIPKVILTNTDEIEYVENEEYSLTGKTDPNSQLTLNGQRVKINTDGEFDFKLNLNKGTNTFKFVINKNNRSKTTILKKVYLK